MVPRLFPNCHIPKFQLRRQTKLFSEKTTPGTSTSFQNSEQQMDTHAQIFGAQEVLIKSTNDEALVGVVRLGLVRIGLQLEGLFYRRTFLLGFFTLGLFSRRHISNSWVLNFDQGQNWGTFFIPGQRPLDDFRPILGQAGIGRRQEAAAAGSRNQVHAQLLSPVVLGDQIF